MPWRRLIQRELVPFLALAVLWGTILAFLGPRKLALVFAANLCVNAAQGVSAIATARPVRLRRPALPDVFRQAQFRAWRLEFASMIAALLALAFIAVVYAWFDEADLVSLLAIMAWGLPARCNGPLKARGIPGGLPRILRGWFAAGAVVIALLVSQSVDGVAWALVVREWLTSLAIAVFPQRPPAPKLLARTRSDVPPWSEFLELTAALSMRRFFYHASHSILHFVVGPFGTAVARTSRGLGLLHKASSIRSMQLVVTVAACAGLFGTGLVLWLVPGPGALALSALFLRIGALATSAAVWKMCIPTAGNETLADAAADDD